MKKWEYLTSYYETEVNVDVLNELGNEGWELISVLPPRTIMQNRWIFKREKIEKVLPDQAD